MKVNCPNCGQPITIDEPNGEAYITEPAGYVPVAPQGGTLPSPAVALPNTTDNRIVHHVQCPTPAK